MVKIKICGITVPVEIEYANELLPDFIGFVFAQSRRRISPGQAADLKEKLCPAVRTVGVFVNEEIKTIQKLCSQNILDLVQLHGDEDAAYLEALKKKISKPVIRAVRVQSREDVEKALALPADFVLFDAYRPGSYGGTGEAFDAELLAGYCKPFFLAGGLNENNIASSIRASHTYCVDISSGAETDGKKDRIKMKTIINTVRSVK